MYSLKTFKYMFAATKQMISLRLEHQKRNKENDQLKSCEPEGMACELSQWFSQNITTHEYYTQDQHRLQELQNDS